MRTSSGMDFPNSGTDFPNEGIEFPFPHDLTTDKGAYEAARTMARRWVMITQQDAKTVENAIQSMSKQYRLGTFIENLWKQKPATITVPKFVRLKMGLVKAIHAHQMQIEHDQMFQKHLGRMGF